MPTKTLAAYSYLNLLLHPGAAPVLETEWLGFANSADFRTAMLEALRLARLHRVRGWVADDRRLGAVRPTDLDWVRDSLLLPLSTMGLHRFAHLESEEVLNRLIINGMYQSTLPGVAYEFRHFADLGAARAWAGGMVW